MTEANRENDGAGRMSRRRIAAWIGAALLMLLPLVAGAPWSPGDYVFAALLLFGSLGLYEIAVRAATDTTYRTGAGMAIVGAFLLLWVNAAVGITDSDADILYLVVVAMGIVGAVVARGRAAGMVRVMLTMAILHALVGAIALIAGIVPAFNSAFEILGLTALWVVLFGGSALLFREAARGGSKDE